MRWNSISIELSPRRTTGWSSRFPGIRSRDRPRPPHPPADPRSPSRRRPRGTPPRRGRQGRRPSRRNPTGESDQSPGSCGAAGEGIRKGGTRGGERRSPRPQRLCPQQQQGICQGALHLTDMVLIKQNDECSGWRKSNVNYVAAHHLFFVQCKRVRS